MSSVNETTTKFRVDVSELKKGIQEANRQIKLANAEFKAAASGMDDWAKSADGVSKKVDQLETVLESQKKILESYQKQLDLISKEYGENSKEADEMRIKIANQQAVVNGTTKELEKYRTVLGDLQKEEAAAADGAKDQAKAYDDLKGSVKDQQARLDELKNEYKQVVVEQGKNSDAAKDLAKQIDGLSGELKDNKKALDDADKAADELDKSLEDSGKSAKQAAEGGFTVLKGALADLASKAISAVISGLKDMAKGAADAWKEFDEGRDTVIKLTGATGDMAKQLTKSYSNVSRSIVADSADIGEAIGEVNTRFGINGEELESLSTQYLKFAQITGSDVVSSIDDTQKALSTYGKGVEDASGFLDALAKTSQQTGVDTSTLTKGIISNATAFQEMGLSLEQAVAFMGQLETSGANSETVLNGMRKALKNSAGEGKNLDQALLELQSEILNGTNGMDGLNAAYELFGKSGDQIYGAIKNGTLSFEDLTSAVVAAGGAVDDTFAETLDSTDGIKLSLQNLKVTAAELIDKFLKENGPAIENVITAVVNGLTTIMPFVGDLVKVLPTLVPIIASIGAGLAALKIVSVITALVQGFQTFFTVIKAGQGIMVAMNAVMAANPIGLIVAAIAALVAGFIALWNTSEDFRNFWIKLWEGIKQAVSGVVQMITDVFEGVVGFFKKNWKSILTFLINPFAGLFKYAYDNFEDFRNFVDGIVQKVVGFFKGIVDFFKNNWQAILAFLINPFAGLFKYAYDNFEGFREFVDGIVEQIKAFFENLVASIMEFFQPLVTFFEELWSIAKELAVGVWNTIVLLWGLLADWFDENVIKPITDFFTQLWEGIKEKATKAWDALKAAWGVVSAWFNDNVVKPVADFFTGLWDGLKAGATAAWEAVKAVFAVVSGWFSDKLITPVKDFFTEMWTNLKDGAKKAWDGIKEVFGKVADFFGQTFQNAWTKVKQVFSVGGKIFDGIKDGIVNAFKTVVNAIIKGINKVVAIPFNSINTALDTIRNLSIAGVKPFEGLLTRITVPEIPLLRRGGVLERGQVGLLEGDGAEAVVPLEQNQKWVAATARELRQSLEAEGLIGGFGSGAGGNAGGVSYNFIQNNNSPKALDRLEIYRQTRNQLELAKGVS